MCVCAPTWACLHVCIPVCACVCVCASAQARLGVSVCVSGRTCISVWACLCVRACTSVHGSAPACASMLALVWVRYTINAITYIINSTIFSFCTNIWIISVRPVIPGVMICEWSVTLGAKPRGVWSVTLFCAKGVPPDEWLFMHLIWNNSNMIWDTMLIIFVKGSWHNTFITAKYEYSTQNSLFWKIKVCGKVQTVSPVLMLHRYIFVCIYIYSYIVIRTLFCGSCGLL